MKTDMRNFTLRNSIKSNMESVALSMNIEPQYKKSWANMKRLPRSIKESVKLSRAAEQTKIANLAQISQKENYGVKKFLVIKTISGFYCPIGFAKSFKIKDKINLFKFAQENGRQKVKIGRKVYEVEEELNKVNNNIQAAPAEAPITFTNTGKGKTKWNAKRNNINGFGPSKIKAQNDLIETEKRIESIRNH